ncbi:MAG: hypothetical protein AAFR12_07495 [Cyanobacteria bacterium J06626_6]
MKLYGNNATGFEDLPGLGAVDYGDMVIVFGVLANFIAMNRAPCTNCCAGRSV